MYEVREPNYTNEAIKKEENLTRAEVISALRKENEELKQRVSQLELEKYGDTLKINTLNSDLTDLRLELSKRRTRKNNNLVPLTNLKLGV